MRILFSTLSGRAAGEFGVLIATAGPLLVGLAGCNEPGPRVYSAMLYEPEAGCLESYAPLGLVQARDLPSTCVPVCLSLAGQLYVSTVCQPYPSAAAVVSPGDSTDCDAALAAANADGGTPCGQVLPPEAGTD